MVFYILVKLQKGGGCEGFAKRFGSLLKILYCLITLKMFQAKCPKGGGRVQGVPKILDHFS